MKELRGEKGKVKDRWAINEHKNQEKKEKKNGMKPARG